MRGGTRLALLLLAVALAGCLGGVEEAGERLDAADVGPTEPSPDYTQPADRAGEHASALPAAEVDPRASGPAEISRSEFDFGYTVVSDSGAGVTYPAKVNGSVTYPAETEGPHPIVVLLHGRHYTCHVADRPGGGTQACPDTGPTEPIESYRGYTYVAETLASQGFVVASVDANEVNDRDAAHARTPQEGPAGGHYVADAGVRARAQLVLRTLDGFQQVHEGQDPSVGAENTELVDALEGRIDLDGVGLVGHSRGGDGVTYAVGYNEQRTQGQAHEIDAVFAIAPTDYRTTTVAGVAYATLLPSCDGDVYNQQGAPVYDRSRYVADAGPLYQYVAMGANHAFYNTVWTDNIDDGSVYEDPFCGAFREDGGGRLSPEDQRRHGEALVNAFVRTHVAGQDAFEPWLQGRRATPAAACPAGVEVCLGLIQTSYHPPAGERLVIESVDDGEALATNDLGGDARVEDLEAAVCTPPACPSDVNRQGATQLHLAWNGTSRYALELPDEHADVSGFGWLSLRAGLTPGGGQVGRLNVSIALVDADGTEQRLGADEHGRALYEPIGGEASGRTSLDVTLSSVRIPLAGFDEVDLTHVEEVALVTDRSPRGSLLVADVMLQR